jgi:spore coat polysaccharide biosynthesis protein SpsF
LEQIWYSFERVPEADHRIIVTTSRPEDNKLAEKAKDLGFEVFRGEAQNVYSRFQKVCKIYNIDLILRFTGDNPLIDIQKVRDSIHHFLKFYQKSEPVFLSTRNTFMPVGMDIEVFSKEVLSLSPIALTSYDEEHVTPWMYQDSRVVRLDFMPNMSSANCSVTVDTPEQLIVATSIFEWLENRTPSLELVKNFFETQH